MSATPTLASLSLASLRVSEVGTIVEVVPTRASGSKRKQKTTVGGPTPYADVAFFLALVEAEILEARRRFAQDEATDDATRRARSEEEWWEVAYKNSFAVAKYLDEFYHLSLDVNPDRPRTAYKLSVAAMDGVYELLRDAGVEDLADLVKEARSLASPTFDIDSNNDLVPVYHFDPERLKGTYLFLLATVLEDVTKISYRYNTSLGSVIRQQHYGPRSGVDSMSGLASFWFVITPDIYNQNARFRRFRDGYEEDLRVEFSHPFTISPRSPMEIPGRLDEADLAVYTGKLGEHKPLYVNEDVPGFDKRRLHAKPVTASGWPRLQVKFLHPHPRLCNTMLGCAATQLDHYPNMLTVFHGTLHNSATAISGEIDFNASAGGVALGKGFYVTTNPNEAKSYAAKVLRKRRKSPLLVGPPRGMSEEAGSSSIVPTEKYQLEHLTICQFLVIDPDEIKRVPLVGADPRADAPTTKTFVLNPNDKFGNQMVMHAGCRNSLRLIAVHDIHAMHNVPLTGIADTAHEDTVYYGVDSLP